MKAVIDSFCPFTGITSSYVTRHSGHFSLLRSAGWEMSTGRGAVTVLCGWEGNHSVASYRPCVTGSVDLAAFSAVNVVTDEYLAMKSPPRG